MRQCLPMLLLIGGLGAQAEPAAGIPAPGATPVVAVPENPLDHHKKLPGGAGEPKVAAVYVDRYDQDGDGRLSDAEQAAAIKQMADACLPVLFSQFDKDANGKLEGAEETAALAAALKQYDLNGDGRFDIREAAKMNQAAKLAVKLDAAKQPRREKADKLPVAYVDRYDLDGDGKLSEAEMVAAAQRMADGCLQVLFKEFDKDGNGILEGAEHQEAMVVALKEYDLNGDGRFDFGEAMKMSQKVKESKRQLLEKGARDHKETLLLQRYDQDGDGKLNEEELRRAKEMKQENIKVPPLDE